MTAEELKDIALCGETTTVQFKQEFTGQKEIAKEMIAFANSRGGKILFGVEDKTGKLLVLSYEDIQTISRELGNAANEQIRPTIYIETEVVRVGDMRFLICTVTEGKNKPYKNLTGEIWVKQGADKRRITENSEILALFQDSGSYQTDAAGVDGSSFEDIDRYAIDEYINKVYATNLEALGNKAEQMLKNIHVLNHAGIPTLAGYLFFGKHPEYNCPTCMVKAVSFFGNKLGGTQYRDTKEILGNMPQIYEKSMAFLKSNLHNIQEPGASFNTLGKLEIAEDVLEEVLQNALVHRDLLRPAPIRIFIFDNRVEIISPGALAGGLTVEDIQNGKTYQRNPFMATFATNALHYRGIGSGIVRILAVNNNVTVTNDDSGKEFKVTIFRNYAKVSRTEDDSTQKSTQKTEGDTQEMNNCTIKGEYFTLNCTVNNASCTVKCTVNDVSCTVNMPIRTKEVLWLIAKNNNITTEAISKELGCSIRTVKNHTYSLAENGLIVRKGSDKTGHWEVTTPSTK